MQMALALSFTTGFLLLLAGIISLVLSWADRRAANIEADLYLESVLQEITSHWPTTDYVESALRRQLLLFDKREAVVQRPGESWALIPYAVRLLGMLVTK